MKHVSQIPALSKGPSCLRLDAGLLVLPPITLRDLPNNGVIGHFMCVAALRFATPGGTVAVFLHDLADADLALILDAQRYEAKAQLGSNYANSGDCRGLL